jgi:hypothetical protein
MEHVPPEYLDPKKPIVLYDTKKYPMAEFVKLFPAPQAAAPAPNGKAAMQAGLRETVSLDAGVAASDAEEPETLWP